MYKHEETSTSENEINEKRDYWVLINNIKSDFLIKPIKLSPAKELKTFFFIKHYSFEIFFEENEINLE